MYGKKGFDSSRFGGSLLVVSLLVLLSMSMPVHAVNEMGAVEPVEGSFTWENPLPTGNNLMAVDWHPSGSYALIGGNHGTLLKYDGNTFQTMDFYNNYTINDIDWHPSGSYALILTDKGMFTWDDGSVTLLWRGEVNKVSWAPNGSYALITGRRGSLGRYDGVRRSSVETDTDAMLRDIAWHPTGESAIILGYPGVLLEYDGVSARTVDVETEDLLTCASWSPDGEYALVGSYSKLYRYEPGSIEELDDTPRHNYHAIEWSPDGEYALLAGYKDERSGWEMMVKRFDGTHLTDMDNVLESDPSTLLEDLSWKPDGSYAIMVGQYGRVLKHQTENTVLSTGSVAEYFSNIAWRPDGTEALLLDWERVWTYSDGTLRQIDNPLLVEVWLNDVVWSHDGSYALIIGQRGVALKYESGTLEELSTGTFANLYGMDLHPDGSHFLMVGSHGTILKYDGTSFRSIPNRYTKHLLCVGWHPDGSSALIGGMDGILLEYDGRLLQDVNSGTIYDLYQISWSNSGDYAVSTGVRDTFQTQYWGLFHYNGQGLTQFAEGRFAVPRCIAWSPTHNHALIIVGSNIAVYDGSQMTVFRANYVHGQWMDLNPSTGWFTVVGQDGMICEMDPHLVERENTKPVLDLVDIEYSIRIKNGRKTTTTVSFSGRAYDVEGVPEYVEIRINDDEWKRTDGMALHSDYIFWYHRWDCENIPPGEHFVSVRAFDGKDYSDVMTETLWTYRDHEGPNGSDTNDTKEIFPIPMRGPYILAYVLIPASAAIATLFIYRRRRKRKKATRYKPNVVLASEHEQ